MVLLVWREGEDIRMSIGASGSILIGSDVRNLGGGGMPDANLAQDVLGGQWPCVRRGLPDPPSQK